MLETSFTHLLFIDTLSISLLFAACCPEDKGHTVRDVKQCEGSCVDDASNRADATHVDVPQGSDSNKYQINRQSLGNISQVLYNR